MRARTENWSGWGQKTGSIGGCHRYAPRSMNQNVLLLIVLLVAVNLILITVAVIRSMLRSRDQRGSGN